jgi:hypothetical protein
MAALEDTGTENPMALNHALRPSIPAECYVRETGKSMKGVELAGLQRVVGWRYISLHNALTPVGQFSMRLLYCV